MAGSIDSTSNSFGDDENSVYHLIIVSPHRDRLLAVRDPSRTKALPSVTLSNTQVFNWEQNCEQLVKTVKHQFGVHGCVLGPFWKAASVPDIDEDILVIENLQHTSLESKNNVSWIAREDIFKEKWKSVKAEIATELLLSAFFEDQSFRYAHSKSPIWRTMGWFREVERWVRDVLCLRGFLVLDISHVHNTEDSEVLRVKAVANGAALSTATKPPSVFYVKTGREDSFEAILTNKITSFSGSIVPKVVAVNEEWNTFIQHDAGTPFCRPDPILLLGGLAALQRTSISHLEELKRVGMHTHSVKWVINNIEKILRHPLIKNNGVFADEVFLLQRISAIKCLLRHLDSHGLPDTIVHGDLHIGNIAVGEEQQGTPTCSIIDWGSAFLGNPLLDVAVLLENLDLEADRHTQTVLHYLACWGWQIPVLTLRNLLRIASLCYWMLNLYYAIQGCQQTPAGEHRNLDELASGILIMSQHLGDIKV